MSKKEILFLSLGIFMTVIAWLVADLYHASTEEKIKTKVSLPNLQNYKISKEMLKILKEKTE